MKILDRLEEIIIATLMALATTLIFVAVTHRYGTGIANDIGSLAKANNWPQIKSAADASFTWLSSIDLSWAQELCTYMFVWMAKFGAAYGVRQGIHVGVDVLINMLGTNAKRPVIAFALLSGALFTGIIGTLGASFVYSMSLTNTVSPDLEVPKWIVYLAIPLGSYLMCFRFLQVLVVFLRTGEVPHSGHGADIEVPGLDKAALEAQQRLGGAKP